MSRCAGGQEEAKGRHGQTWIWTAIDTPSPLLIAFWIGGRELDDAREFLKDVVGRLKGKPLFVSDELSHYGTVLAQLFHKLIAPEPTGKRGRPRSP